MTDFRELLRGRRVVLLDFDGPVCAAFGPDGGEPLADAMRQFAASRSIHLDKSDAPSDPLRVLLDIARLDEGAAAAADDELRRLERQVIKRAVPTPGAIAVLLACAATGRRVAIVSNNAGESVEDYLMQSGLNHLVSVVVGRPFGAPTRMKPKPWILEQALGSAGAEPAEAVMVGDSSSDVLAARALGIACVGYANKAGKAATLSREGAAAIVESMVELATLLEESRT